jgi:hypothetical protein
MRQGFLSVTYSAHNFLADFKKKLFHSIGSEHKCHLP